MKKQVTFKLTEPVKPVLEKYQCCLIFEYSVVYWLLLFGMVVCGGALGPAVLVVDAPVLLKCAWRYFA